MNRMSRGGPGEQRRGWFGLALVGVLAAGALALWSMAPRGGAPEPELLQPSSPAAAPARALAAPKQPPVRADWPAGSLRAPQLTLQFALAHLDRRTSRRAGALVRKLAARELPGFRVVTLKGDLPEGARVLGIGEQQSQYSEETLRWRGKGLSDAARAALAEGRPGTVLVLRAPGDDPRALRGLLAVLGEASRQLGAVVEDWEARLVLSPEAFAEREKDAFQGELPVVLRHVTIDAYDRGDGLVRSISVGMSKLGLPDVVVNGSRSGDVQPVGNLVNAVCQWMVEHGEVAREGALDLELGALRADAVREPDLAGLVKGARPKVTLTIARGERDEGDAENRLLELTFGGLVEGTPTERQSAVLAAVFGADDKVTRIEHDQRLLAASAEARRRLLALKPAWQAGRKPGEHLLVKGPFETASGGREWMWLEVTAWKGTEISGILANDPEDVPGLRPGAPVSVEEGSVFDYLLRREDGTEEGNETGKLIEAAAGAP